MKYLLLVVLLCSGCSSVIKPLPSGGSGYGYGYGYGGGSTIRKNIFLNRMVVETPSSYGFFPK